MGQAVVELGRCLACFHEHVGKIHLSLGLKLDAITNLYILNHVTLKLPD